MIKTSIGIQRYNNKMDRIFKKAMETMVSAKNGKMYDKRFWFENEFGEIIKITN